MPNYNLLSTKAEALEAVKSELAIMIREFPVVLGELDRVYFNTDKANQKRSPATRSELGIRTLGSVRRFALRKDENGLMVRIPRSVMNFYILNLRYRSVSQIRKTVRHEIGHALHNLFQNWDTKNGLPVKTMDRIDEIFDEYGKEKIRRTLGAYATTNGKEMFAEWFALCVTNGRDNNPEFAELEEHFAPYFLAAMNCEE